MSPDRLAAAALCAERALGGHDPSAPRARAAIADELTAWALKRAHRGP